MKKQGFCNKCGYAGECEVVDGMLRHYRRDGKECRYTAAEIRPSSPMTTRIPEQRLVELEKSLAELKAASTERLDPKRRIEQVRRLQAAELNVGSHILRCGEDLIATARRERVLAEQVRVLESEVRALRDALTPTTFTKSAYISEFSFEEDPRDGDEVFRRTVPWTTIKEIMAAILARADAAHNTTLAKLAEGGGE